MTGTQNKSTFYLFAAYLAGLLAFAGGCAAFHFLFGYSHAVLFLSFISFFILHGISVFWVFSRKNVELQAQRSQMSQRVTRLQEEITATRAAIEIGHRKLKDFIKLRFLVEELSKNFAMEQTARTLAREVYHFFDKVNVRVFLYLFHPQTGQLMLEAAEGSRVREKHKPVQEDVFDHWVIKTHQPLLVSDTSHDDRFPAGHEKSAHSSDFKSLIITPLKSDQHIFGILRLESERPHFFNADDFRLFSMAGELGSVAVENAGFYERILDIAVRDGLTGLYLRREFMQCLDKELNKKIYQTTGLSLLMLDLDHFKMFNDKHGHMSGDIILKWVGQFLDHFCKERGLTACRYGGEEFCVMAPHSQEPMAMDLGEKICAGIAQHEFMIRREKFFITVSVGVSSFPEYAKSSQDLIHLADQAMYAAKKQGRNRVCSSVAGGVR